MTRPRLCRCPCESTPLAVNQASSAAMSTTSKAASGIPAKTSRPERLAGRIGIRFQREAQSSGPSGGAVIHRYSPIGMSCFFLGEQGAEASEAREADFHADVSHGMVTRREQVLGGVQAGLDPKLAGCDAEDSLELPDEMKRRNLNLAREVRYRRRGLAQLPQQIAARHRRRKPSCLSSIVRTQCGVRRRQVHFPFSGLEHRWSQDRRAQIPCSTKICGVARTSVMPPR